MDGVPARASGAPCQEDRPRVGGHEVRPAMVPVLLLHDRREPRLRAQLPDCHQEGSARHSEGFAALRDGAGAHCAAHGRQRLCVQLRVHGSAAERSTLRAMARVQPRRDHALLLAPPPRGGVHQDEPAEDHCPEHRLALHHRAQERNEVMNRREFLARTALATGAGLLGAKPSPVAAAEPPPETTTIRLIGRPDACFAPLFVAEPLLLAEGFRRVEYVPVPLPRRPIGTRDMPGLVALSNGQVDLSAADPPSHILSFDAGGSYVLLAGLHAGCFKLLASERIRTVRELKGKTVAIPSVGRHAFVACIVWASGNLADSMQLFADGTLDAFLGFAPEPDELLARKAGHVLVDTLIDKPWSQYFCCIVAGSREFVRKNPIATKRALRD